MCKQRPESLSPDSADALAFPRERFHTKAHAFGKLGADESAHAVRLPPGRGDGVHEQMHLRRAVRPYVSP